MKLLRALPLTLAFLLLAATSAAWACELPVLAEANAHRVGEDFRGSIVAPQEYQRRLLTETGRYLTPLHCAGVRDVVFVAGEPDRDGRAALGWVYTEQNQSTLHISSLPNSLSEADLKPAPNNRIVGNAWATAIEVLVHESTHAAVHLLNTQVVEGDCTFWFFFCDEATDASQWSAASVALADEAMERMRLRVSFQAEWNRVHSSFVAAGLARPYGPRLAPSEVASGGFMTAYGGTAASEDIAEMASQVQASGISDFAAITETVNRGQRTDLGCMALAGVERREVPGNLAALYTKILLLRDVGLVTEEAAAACMGRTGIDTRGTPGIHFFTQEGEYRRTFTDGLGASIGTRPDGDRYKFQLAAEGTLPVNGEEHAATFLLTLDMGPASGDIERVSWPRGLYQLELLGENTLVIAVPDAGHVTYHVDNGMVLITSATSDLIEGAIIMNRATRPHAPMGVPMAAADLPRLTFRIGGSP